MRRPSPFTKFCEFLLRKLGTLILFNAQLLCSGLSAPPVSASTLPAGRAKSFSSKIGNSSNSSSKLYQQQQTPPLNATKQQQQQQQPSIGRNAFSLKKPKSSSKNPLPPSSSSSSATSSVDARGRMTTTSSSNGAGGMEWTCASCTFVNTKATNVCEMCDKSRKGATLGRGNLKSGGHQCPQCTLVNDKGVMTCNACGHNLLGGPTYNQLQSFCRR